MAPVTEVTGPGKESKSERQVRSFKGGVELNLIRALLLQLKDPPEDKPWLASYSLSTTKNCHTTGYCMTHCVTPQLPWQDLFYFFPLSLFYFGGGCRGRGQLSRDGGSERDQDS